MIKTNLEIENIDWDSIIPILTAYALVLLKMKAWFRGAKIDSYLQGKQASDYVFEGIRRYLLHPEKFDSTKGILSDYIKFNIIKTLIGNDSRSSENKTSLDFSKNDEDSSYIDSLASSADEYLDEQIDYENVLNAIQREIKNDKIVDDILLGRTQGLKRREIIDVFKLDPKDYDLGVKRLETIGRKIFNQYQIKNSNYERKLTR